MLATSHPTRRRGPPRAACHGRPPHLLASHPHRPLASCPLDPWRHELPPSMADGRRRWRGGEAEEVGEEERRRGTRFWGEWERKAMRPTGVRFYRTLRFGKVVKIFNLHGAPWNLLRSKVVKSRYGQKTMLRWFGKTLLTSLLVTTGPCVLCYPS